MATTVATIAESLGFDPILPGPAEIDPARLAFGYNDAADTLYVFFYERGQPAVSVDVDEFLYLLVDRRSQRVVGLQIEGYLAFAVREHPEWLPLAELAGIPQAEIDKARAAIDEGQRRRAVVLPILKELDLLAP
jgi:hypothetical protein